MISFSVDQSIDYLLDYSIRLVVWSIKCENIMINKYFPKCIQRFSLKQLSEQSPFILIGDNLSIYRCSSTNYNLKMDPNVDSTLQRSFTAGLMCQAALFLT